MTSQKRGPRNKATANGKRKSYSNDSLGSNSSVEEQDRRDSSDFLNEDYRRAILLYQYLEKRQRKKGKVFLKRNTSYYRADTAAWSKSLPEDAQVDVPHCTVNIKLRIVPPDSKDDSPSTFESDFVGKNVTVFCIVGRLSEDTKSIEPLTVGVLNCVIGQTVEGNLLFPFEGSKSGASTSQAKHKPSLSSRSEQTGFGSGKSNSCTTALIFVVWDEHMDLKSNLILAEGRRGGGAEAVAANGDPDSAKGRYLTDCCRGDKIFGVIQKDTEVLFDVLQALEVEKNERTGQLSFEKQEPGWVLQEPLDLRRGRLNIDNNSDSHMSSPGTDQARSLALWPTNLKDENGEDKPIPFCIKTDLRIDPNFVCKKIETVRYPTPNTDVSLTYNYRLGSSSARRKDKRCRQESFSDFSCAFCNFKASSQACLMDHLKANHGLFRFEGRGPIQDDKKPLPLRYHINVEPPKPNVFSKNSFLTVEIEEMRSDKKTHHYFRGPREARMVMRGMHDSILSECEVRRAAEESRSKKRKMQVKQPVKVTVNKDRTFYHARTGQEMTRAEIDGTGEDSDNEGAANYLEYVSSKIETLRGIRKEEARFMTAWNKVMILRDGPNLDMEMFELAKGFAEDIPSEDETMRKLFVQQVLVLWDHAIITKEQGRTLLEVVNR